MMMLKKQTPAKRLFFFLHIGLSQIEKNRKKICQQQIEALSEHSEHFLRKIHRLWWASIPWKEAFFFFFFFSKGEADAKGTKPT